MRILLNYKQQIPALFWFNSLLIASSGTDSKNFFRIGIVRRG
jgi:hypothetical protein